MRVRNDPTVEPAIRTLSDDDRRKLVAWLDHLKNWENDAHIRKISRDIPEPGVKALDTTDDLRIFFKLDLAAKEITVLDIAKPSRFKNVPVRSAME